MRPKATPAAPAATTPRAKSTTWSASSALGPPRATTGPGQAAATSAKVSGGPGHMVFTASAPNSIAMRAPRPTFSAVHPTVWPQPPGIDSATTGSPSRSHSAASRASRPSDRSSSGVPGKVMTITASAPSTMASSARYSSVEASPAAGSPRSETPPSTRRISPQPAKASGRDRARCQVASTASGPAAAMASTAEAGTPAPR